MKRILKYIQKYKLFVIIPFTAMIVSIVLDMFNPYFKQVIVDRIIQNGEHDLTAYVFACLGAIAASRAVLGYIREYMFDCLGSKVSLDLKNDLFGHIQKLPYKYFDNKNTGELMSRMSEDVDNIWRAVSFGIGLLIDNIIYLLLAAAILFYRNWKLALVSLIAMPIIGYIAKKLENDVDKAYEKISDHTAFMNTTAQENIAGARLVKAFSREKYEVLKFLKMNQTYYDLNMQQARMIGKYFPLNEFLSNMCALAVIVVGGIFVIKGEMTIGLLVAFNAYVWMPIWSMRNLGWLTNLTAQANASAKKIYAIMDVEPEIKDKENALHLEKIEGYVKFENVSFKYEDEYVLKDINIEAKPGSTIAIMGTTGSGKSSLVNLIPRYYDVQLGKVLVDGHDVRDIKIEDLRKNISVVSQDTFLFSDSVFENIKMGNQNASPYEVKAASYAACADEFVSDLPDKYRSVIGERGIGLSGGQKQRISIARALIKNAPILILDDATSALDMDTEYELLKNLHDMIRKSTTFIIAHRISAVKNADEILFVENGEIVERGTHHELLEKKGKYYEIYCEQFKDFEDVECEVG